MAPSPCVAPAPPAPPPRPLLSSRGGGGGGVRAPGFRARLSRCPLRRVHSLPCPPSCHGPPGQAAARGAGGSSRRSRAADGSGRAASPPYPPPAVITPRPPRARGPGRPAAPPLPAAGSAAVGSMEGSGHAARSVGAGSPAARPPGPARLALPSALLSRALLPSPPAEEGVRRGPRCRPPLASRCSAAGSPSASLPPSSSPGPLLPRAASRPPPTPAPSLPASESLAPTPARGSVSSGSLGPRLAGAPGGRPSRSAGRPGSPPRSRPPPGSAERTPGMPRPHPAPLEGARPYLPSPSSAPRPGPRRGAPGVGRRTGTGSHCRWAGAEAEASDAWLLPARRSMGLGAGPAGRGSSPRGWRSGRASRGSGEALIIPSARPTRRFFSLGFAFFFRCGTFCKLFFFLTCKAVTTNCSSPPRGGGERGEEGREGFWGSSPSHNTEGG